MDVSASIASSNPERWSLNFTTLKPLFGVNSTQNGGKELHYNGTGYYIEDEVEPGLNDLQTVILACFATLVPLVISVITAFGIRILWTRYKKQKDEVPQYDGILEQCPTNESLQPLHNQRCETQLSLSAEEIDDSEGISQVRSNNHSNTNGSIITMTLKNNHLIVETEERNDIEEDSRETTMKYSPGARDGVFVVEVQQGVRRSPSITHPEPELSASVSDQCALVHNPPDRCASTEPTLASLSRTGLAQSDHSLSGRYSYCYSNQVGYDSGSYGYAPYAGYVAEGAPFRPKNDDKPKITAAVYKNRSATFDDDAPDSFGRAAAPNPILESIS